MAVSKPDRLREPPRERFAPLERVVDLDDCFRELLAEPHEPVDGHRQIAIARQNDLTLVAFHFEEGARLPAHLVDGQVTTHVLDGHLAVRTRDRTHHLRDGQLFVLAPGVPHDLVARRESRVLLTVYLDP